MDQVAAVLRETEIEIAIEIEMEMEMEIEKRTKDRGRHRSRVFHCNYVSTICFVSKFLSCLHFMEDQLVFHY